MLNRIKYLVLFLLFFPTLFATSVLASPQIEINEYPKSVTAGEEFKVLFTSSSLDTGSTYLYKSIGGKDFQDVQTQSDNGDWLNWNSSWDDFPKFIANNATESASVKSRFKTDVEAKDLEFKVRIREGVDNYDSGTVFISVASALPTPTPTPKATPTPQPTKTPTPTPTPTPPPTKKPVKTIIPTLASSISPTEKSTGENNDGSILGLRDELGQTPQPEEDNGVKAYGNFSNIPWYSMIIIALGIIVIGFSGFYFFKNKNKDYNKGTDKEFWEK